VSVPVVGRAFMSIGDVLTRLRPDFPDITISKIRFLEAEGLVAPERTGSGYRKFARADVDRLRYVLTAQRDHYLPLRVIREHLAALDRGLEPASTAGAGPTVPIELTAAEGLPTAEDFGHGRDPSELRLSREELCEAASISPGDLDQLEAFGLLDRRESGAHYGAEALVIAKTVGEMARFGVEARHLRPFKAAADREIGLVEQVISPLARQRNPEARSRADEIVREMAALSVRLHATLVRAGLRNISVRG
jgi:DNA-binding transcriptional MerR regulator